MRGAITDGNINHDEITKRGAVVNDDQLAVQTLHTYKAARAVIAPILSSVELFGLLRGAFESGMLAVARTPSSPAHIAAAINMDQTRVIEFCTALDAHGIFG
jgi:hypothetical protein